MQRKLCPVGIYELRLRSGLVGKDDIAQGKVVLSAHFAMGIIPNLLPLGLCLRFGLGLVEQVDEALCKAFTDLIVLGNICGHLLILYYWTTYQPTKIHTWNQ